MNEVFYLLLSVLLNTTSHLLLKRGVLRGTSNVELNNSSSLSTYILIPEIWLGIFFNGLAAICWLFALSGVSLSYAFPFLSLNYILIPLGAMFLYKEPISRVRAIGIMVICIGIFLIALS